MIADGGKKTQHEQIQAFFQPMREKLFVSYSLAINTEETSKQILQVKAIKRCANWKWKGNSTWLQTASTCSLFASEPDLLYKGNWLTKHW